MERGGVGRRLITAQWLSRNFMMMPRGKENLECENMEYETESTGMQGSPCL